VEMAVQETCKHYVLQTIPSGERIQRCRLKANLELPFACPTDCLFYEARTRVTKIGWEIPKSKDD
jgi:hypothetical protein